MQSARDNGKPLVPHLIGIGGYAGVGKDTVAASLTKHFGFERHGFADLIRDGLYAVDPYVPIRSELLNKDGTSMLYMKHMREIIDSYTKAGLTWLQAWDEAKKNPEVRVLMQRFGDEFGRRMLHPLLWCEFLLAKLGEPPPERVVIPDVRYPNEADWIRGHRGRVIRVDRPGVGPLDEHASETEVDKVRYDTKIVNDGSIEELAGKLANVLTALKT